MSKKIFILIIFLLVSGLLFFNFRETEEVGAAIETRYFRGDTHTINGLTAYKLLTTQSTIPECTVMNTYSGNFLITHYLGIRAWKRASNGSETEIGTAGTIKAIASGFDSGLISGSWSVPATALDPTDAIVVRVYGDFFTPPTTLLKTFITERLGTSGLRDATWTVYYYLERYYSASLNQTEYRFCFDNGYNSRIENFSYISPPTVLTDAATNIGSTAATLNGNITDTGGQNADLRGFEWGTTQGGPYPNSWTEGTSGNYQYGTGVFSYNLTGLTPGTTYYFRAKAHNSFGWGYGSEMSFTTSIASPAVSTVDATGITKTQATLWGQITSTGGQNADLRGFEWGTSSGSYPNSWTEGTSGNYQYGTGVFSYNLTGLTPNTTYYFRAKAHNSAGWGYGSEMSFVATDPNLYGWAWSERIGWISFNYKNCDTDNNGYIDSGVCGGDNSTTPIKPYGVYLPKFDAEGDPVGSANYKANFKGYAWSPNIGWINFNPPGPYPSPLDVDCYPSSAFLQVTNARGLVRACAGAPNPDICGGQTVGNEEAPNPNSGGWNGWICLNDEGVIGGDLYGVTLDTTLTPNEFKNWAWGGGGTSTNGENAVVGWMSWNCSNRGVCTAATAEGGPSNYKVIYKPENTAPTAGNLQLATLPAYCNVNPGEGQFNFQWSYSDVDGDSQYAFEFLVNDTKDFNNPEVHRKYCNTSSNTQQVSVKTSLVSASRTYCAGDPQGEEITVNTPDAITYNTHYYWAVRVKDSAGAWSDWTWYNDPSNTNEDPSDGIADTFTTISHAKPWTDFKWCPDNPNVNDTIQFCSITETGVCESTGACPPSAPFTLPSPETTCYNSTCNRWQWDFESDAIIDCDTNTNPACKNPTHSYSTQNYYYVTLTVTDSSGYSCSMKRRIFVGVPLSLPQWKEIPPF
jgi:hypothetical protein